MQRERQKLLNAQQAMAQREAMAKAKVNAILEQCAMHLYASRVSLMENEDLDPDLLRQTAGRSLELAVYFVEGTGMLPVGAIDIQQMKGQKDGGQLSNQDIQSTE